MKQIVKITAVVLAVAALTAVLLLRGSDAPAAENSESAQHSEIILTSTSGQQLTLSPNAADIELPDGSFVQSLIAECNNFTGLNSVSFPDGAAFSSEDVSAIKTAALGIEINYRVIIGQNEIDPETRQISLAELQNAESITVEELSRELAKLPQLESLTLNAADEAAETEDDYISQSQTGLVSTGLLSFDKIAELQNFLPDLEIDYSFYLYGQKVSLSDESLEYVKTQIGDEGLENFRLIMPCMKNLSYLKLDTCDTTSECMDQLRDDYPGIKVVWRVWISRYGKCGDGKYDRYNTLTDAEKIWATGTVWDDTAQELKYCTDVRYLDLGHNAGLTNVDFINYMPKLEVAVLSITYISDISPLANCPELEFLELFRTYVTDLTPLASCTKLQHLYVYDEHRVGLTDISPIMGLNSLKRFYCTIVGDAVEQGKQFREQHPDCETDFSWVFIGYTNWRIDYRTGEYAERYALLREQFGYDTYDMSK